MKTENLHGGIARVYSTALRKLHNLMVNGFIQRQLKRECPVPESHIAGLAKKSFPPSESGGERAALSRRAGLRAAYFFGGSSRMKDHETSAILPLS